VFIALALPFVSWPFRFASVIEISTRAAVDRYGRSRWSTTETREARGNFIGSTNFTSRSLPSADYRGGKNSVHSSRASKVR